MSAPANSHRARTRRRVRKRANFSGFKCIYFREECLTLKVLGLSSNKEKTVLKVIAKSSSVSLRTSATCPVCVDSRLCHPRGR
jgi:hypothetical protein